MRMRAQDAQLFHRLDKIDAVVVMFLDTRRDRENIRVKDDIFGWKADAEQQFVGAFADFYLALFSVRLACRVERHHHDGGTIGHAQAGVMQKRVFAFFHADGVHHRLA